MQVNKVSFENDPEQVDPPVLDFYLRYWREKRGGNRLPPRSEMRPSEMRTYLASITLAEALPGMDDFLFRIVGTKVAQYFLADATGKTIRQLYAAATKPVIEGIVHLHRAPIKSAKPLLIHASATLVEGLFFSAFDVLYLPLANDKGEGAFVLGAYFFPQPAKPQLKFGSSLPQPMLGPPPAIVLDTD